MPQPPGEFPGFGLPLNYTPPEKLFRNAIDCERSQYVLIQCSA